MLKFLKFLWPSRIRYQLILGVALVHLFLMTVFVFDLVSRQRNFLLDYSRKETESLAMTLSVNSSSWVLANDVAGLSEIVNSMKRYPGIKYAMIISPDGRVLAHIDNSRQGLYLADKLSLSLLKAPPKVHTVLDSNTLLDIAAPIVAGNGDFIGWARIGMGNAEITKNLNIVSRNGVFYTLLAIFAGSIFAFIIGNRLVKGLDRLVSIAARIRDGDRNLRIPITHNDEIATLSEGFNQMLNSIEIVEKELHKSAAELNQLSMHLIERVNEEVEKNRLKDHILFEQSRLSAIGDLLVNISHQWRQPLNAVSVLAQEIRDAYRFNELTAGYLDKVVKAMKEELDTLSSTIDDFRSFYHVEKDKKRFNVADIVRKTLSVIADYFKSNDITVDFQIKDDVTIEGYPNEFSRVILAILNNAKDVFKERNVSNGHIKIELHKESSTGRVILKISDNGGGVKDDIINKIFDPYFTTKPKSRGTGLGLYMAKELIQRDLQGVLRAENIEGGLEFIIEV